MFEAVLNESGPVYMRIGRSPSPVLYRNPGPIEIGKADMIKQGFDLTIIACGSRVYPSLIAAEELVKLGISARVINLRSVKPIDQELIISCCKETGAIITVEDHSIFGGMGSAIAEVVVQNYPVPMKILGVNDSFGCSGEHYELFKKYRIDVEDIINNALNIVKKK